MSTQTSIESMTGQSPDDRFDELFGVAYRAGFAVLGVRADAEDVAQETLARLLSRLRPVPDDRVVPWVARVATNLSIDRWRRLQRERRHQSATGHDETTQAASTAIGRRDELVAALRDLPRGQRQVVVLRYIVDLTERETAAALGCSVGNVKSASARALRKLRNALGDDGAAD